MSGFCRSSHNFLSTLIHYAIQFCKLIEIFFSETYAAQSMPDRVSCSSLQYHYTLCCCPSGGHYFDLITCKPATTCTACDRLLWGMYHQGYYCRGEVCVCCGCGHNLVNCVIGTHKYHKLIKFYSKIVLESNM